MIFCHVKNKRDSENLRGVYLKDVLEQGLTYQPEVIHDYSLISFVHVTIFSNNVVIFSFCVCFCPFQFPIFSSTHPRRTRALTSSRTGTCLVQRAFTSQLKYIILYRFHELVKVKDVAKFRHRVSKLV